MSGAGDETNRVRAEPATWALTWRLILAFIGSLLVIPAPWTSTALYRYLIDSARLPDGTRLTFRGKGGDIWYWLMLVAAIGMAGQFVPYLALLSIVINQVAFTFILRWLVENTGGDRVSLRFGGDVPSMIGWGVIILISFATIIGWAWAFRYQMRWICGKVTGTHQFTFEGTGWSILWRVLVTTCGCVLIIPIPWLVRWLTVWFVSQIAVTPARA